ncbi:hypothetical protein Clacol_000822 [Clathrus columnatus]|uniref:RING-type domain-containing protein n=1 Tax=Clathrus columnatus TaxID=1419009 RepID=A0AAV5A1W2_9AGAM|nr:hypothetical protein Clacol_000822 [Clathrus columnatus]
MGENTDSASELKLLQEEITIQKQDKAIENTKLGLRCHICLETLRLPQLLVPCGHVACYECLKAWFLNSPNSTASDGDPESSEAEDNTTSARNRRGNNNNSEVAPRPPTNVVHVKKFCHHCRSSVKDRPVPVYALRDLVAIVDPEDESVKKAPPDDLWENIFPLAPLGTPPFQAIQPSPAPDRGEREQTVEREVREHTRNQPIRQSSPIRHRIPNPLPEAFYDNEDHVTRCGICLHEIWGFHCSNERCGAVYNEGLMPINGSDREDGDGSDIWEGFNGSPPFEAQYEYESSFIDDDEEDYNNLHAIFDVDSDPYPEEDTPSLHEISSEEESLSVSALNRPAGSRVRSRRPIVIEDSDDEDEDERPHLIDVSDESESEGESESDVYDYSLRLPVRTRPPRHRILSDEDDEPEIDRLNDDWNRSERSIEDKFSDESEEDVVISEDNSTEEESMSASPQGNRKRFRRQIVSDEEEEDEEESEEDVDGDDGLDGENEETDEESSEPIRQRTIYPTRIQRGSTLLRRRFG